MNRQDRAMDPETFEKRVLEVIAEIPAQFQEYLAGVRLVIQDDPSKELLLSLGLDPEVDTLFGFYDGVPVSERDLQDAGLSDQGFDTIYIYREPLLSACETEEELAEEVRITIIHEVAHHFGLDEDDVDRLGYA